MFKPRDRWGVGIVAAVVALSLSVAPGAAADKSRPCGPTGSSTLAGNSQVRVYRQSVKGRAQVVFGCIRGSKKTSRIGPIVKAGQKAAMRGPIALNGKWVGAVEERPDGGSGRKIFVASRKIGTGKSRRCLIGSGDPQGKAPAVRVVLIGDAGALAWGAITPTPDGRAPIIGACDSHGNRVLDSGAGVELNSMSLSNSTLTWTDAGGTRSERLR